jgi:hypothetical protein
MEMLSKSLPHIIFNKWTFIDPMSNMMAICATWRIWSWNYVDTMNSSTLIPWNSIINVAIMLINIRFIVPHFYNHKNTFCYYWFFFGKTTIFCLVTSTGSTFLDILIPYVATLLWPSVGVKPNTWKKWGFGVLRDSRRFRARHQGPKHLALGCSWCLWKGLEI